MKLSKQMQPMNNTVVLFEFVMIIAAFALVGPVQHRIQAQETEDVNSSKSIAKQDLPSGEEVMTKHIANTGGQDAYDNIKNRVSESTLEIVGQGVSVNLTTCAARPNKTLVKVDSKLTGKIEKGCDGKVVWENSLVRGPVIHDGAQHSTGST